MSKEKDEWGEEIFTPPTASVPALIKHTSGDDEDDDPEDETMAEAIAEDDEAEPEPTVLKTKRTVRVRRSVEECEGLVGGIDDVTVTTLLIVLAKEAMVRGIDPTISVSSATKTPAGGKPTANVNDVWGRIVSRIDRSKKGGYRFEGSPIFGRAIFGRELSNIGVGEDGKAAPVVFGRKDMRGTLWLAVGEKGASFDMSGTTIVGMKLLHVSSTSDDFEKLCDTAEAMLSGVEAGKVTDRRTTEQKLAALDDWE